MSYRMRRRRRRGRGWKKNERRLGRVRQYGGT